MRPDLPAAVVNDPTFAAVKDAALTWNSQSKSYFRNKHRRAVEEGSFGSSSELAKSVYCAIEYCTLCGMTFNEKSVDTLEAAMNYLVYLGYFDGRKYSLVEVHLKELRETRQRTT